jgi:acetyl-CoA carboxylase biotin carboxyl carrier protein
MDIRKVKKLIELLEESELTEIEISEGEESIRLSRSNNETQVYSVPTQSIPPAPLSTVAEPSLDDRAASVSFPADKVSVVSPMVGTYYASPNPDTPAYVELGTKVSVGDTLCVIEAMKIFNPVDTESAGIVCKIFEHSGDPVEFGEPLFLIESLSS